MKGGLFISSTLTIYDWHAESGSRNAIIATNKSLAHLQIYLSFDSKQLFPYPKCFSYRSLCHSRQPLPNYNCIALNHISVHFFSSLFWYLIQFNIVEWIFSSFFRFVFSSLRFFLVRSILQICNFQSSTMYSFAIAILYGGLHSILNVTFLYSLFYAKSHVSLFLFLFLLLGSFTFNFNNGTVFQSVCVNKCAQIA